MLNIIVPFFNMSSDFVQTFVPSVKKLLNSQCKERCWLLSKLLKNDWLHFGIWCKFLLIFFHQTCTVGFIKHWDASSIWRYVYLHILDSSQSESDLYEVFLLTKNGTPI